MLFCYTTNDMKSAPAVILGFIFLSIAVFGVFAMNHGEEYGHAGCIGALARGMACPTETNGPLAFIEFHLSAFKSFSTASLGSLLAFAVLLLFLSLALTAVFNERRGEKPIEAAREQGRGADPPSYLATRYFIHWLSLHENSPSFS